MNKEIIELDKMLAEMLRKAYAEGFADGLKAGGKNDK